MNNESLFFNGNIITNDPKNPCPEAVLVKAGRICAIGSYHLLKLQISNSDNIINLNGKILLPSIIDAHTHFFEMAKLATLINLDSANSISDIKTCLWDFKKHINSDTKGIRGWGWDLNKYQDAQLLDKNFLDKIFPDIPVVLDSHDLHAKWCNSLALHLAKIDKHTPDPQGGSIGRDEHGNPNGFLYELAWELISGVIPEFTNAEKKKMLINSVHNAWEYGINGVNVMENEDRFNLYKQLVYEGLNFRFFWHFPSHQLDQMISKNVKSYTGTEQLMICGMKVFMDGSLGSHSALMFDPYPNSDNYGTTTMSFSEFYALIKKAAEHDIATTVHSIGDRCSYEIIKLFVELNKETKKTLSHRIEHLQALRPQDLDLLRSSGLACAIQPIHMKADIRYIDQLWTNAAKYAFPIKSLLQKNIPIAFSSDAPVETLNPFEGIFSAIERKYQNNPNNPTWFSDEKISALEALYAYTAGSAKISGAEAFLGSISVNKSADMFVLDNFFQENSNFWLTAKSKLSMIHGDIVYRSI